MLAETKIIIKIFGLFYQKSATLPHAVISHSEVLSPDDTSLESDSLLRAFIFL